MMAAAPSSEVAAEGTTQVVAASVFPKLAANTDELVLAAAPSSEVNAEGTAPVPQMLLVLAQVLLATLTRGLLSQGQAR